MKKKKIAKIKASAAKTYHRSGGIYGKIGMKKITKILSSKSTYLVKISSGVERNGGWRRKSIGSTTNEENPENRNQ